MLLGASKAIEALDGRRRRGNKWKSVVCQFRKFNGYAWPIERADVTWIGKIPMNAARRARARTRAAAVPNGVGWEWAVPSLPPQWCW